MLPSEQSFARLPAPPYYAVIFSSLRSNQDDAGYAAASARMVELVQIQPGFLGFESTRGNDGFGITVAYFDSEEAIRHWRNNTEHAEARREGHRSWYDHFELRIARVERAYGGVRREQGHPMKLDALTALIPIDVQRGFDFPPWGRHDNPAMEDNGRRLLQAWRASGRPLLHVRHDSVMAGSSLHPDHAGNAFRDGFEPMASEPVIAKSVNAAFIGTDLDLRLRRLGVTSVVLFGISTDMCVSTTARVAANLGYRTLVVGDACRCFDLDDGAGGTIPAEAIARAHLATLRAEFAEVLDTDDVIAALR